MEIENGYSQTGNRDFDDEAEPDHSPTAEGVRVFESDAWIPVWEQSTPGQKIVLGSVPTSCNLYLEPEPHFAFDVKLGRAGGARAPQNDHAAREHVPMQFEGLQYGNYPIRGNNYVTWQIADDNMQLHAKYSLLDKGLRALRMTDAPTAEVMASLSTWPSRIIGH